MADVLLRAAIETLNKIWLAYREMIYADQIDQIVWKSPRRLVMRTGCTERTKRRWPTTTSPLMMFPGHLCKKPHDKAIVLNFLQCNVAVTHMQCILNWFLKDIAKKIEVAVFHLKDLPLVATLVPDGGCAVSNADFRHICWRITLISGEVYAVDLTGAQYGWFDPVCPWEEYYEKRCEGGEFLRFGFNDDEYMAPLIVHCPDEPAIPGVDNYYASIREHFSETMTAYLRDFEADDFFECKKNQERTKPENLVGVVKKLVEQATLAADGVWNTFPWVTVPEERSYIE